MSESSVPLVVGNPDLQLVLHDFRKPAVSAGVYTIQARNELIDVDPASPTSGQRVDIDPPLPVVEQSYEVRTLQFALNEGDVHSCYPFAGSVGRYPHVLPHITLNRDIVPWERLLKFSRTPDAPWLALMLFAVDELPGQGQPVTRPVTELLRPPPGVTGPDIDPDYVPPDVRESLCETIDVPASLFSAIVAREDELGDLAHTRAVSYPQTRAGGEVLTEGDFAVVLANRFPRTPGGYVAHLVSLEGFAGRLGPAGIPAGELVRLCSLHSWVFVCDTENTLDPEGLLRDLVRPTHIPPDTPASGEKLALRLVPDPGAVLDAYVADRLELGYAPVTYQVPTGESALAWYRGPGTPLTAPALPASLPPSPQPSSDYLLIYEPEHGMFDVSYASAWALGRAIALADPAYSADVVRARRQLANRATALALLALDPQRRTVEPEEVTGVRAFTELAERGPGALVAMAAPQTTVPIPPVPRQPALTSVALARVLDAPDTRLQLRRTAGQLAGDMPAWLDRLALLEWVPFAMLVPDPAMLPPESVRMFRVDPGWVTCLLNGAEDLAAATGLDRALDPYLRAATSNTANQVTPAAAGVLIRSQLVIAWPDFDLTAAGDDGHILTELRRDQMAPDTLLVLYARVPDQVFIREPGAGIHFSIDGEARIGTRQLTPGIDPPLGAPLRTRFPTEASGQTVWSDYLRPAAPGTEVPDVLDLRGPRALIPALAAALGQPGPDLRPAQFGLQLTSAPYQLQIRPYQAQSAKFTESAS
jgi:hypothetical protein